MQVLDNHALDASAHKQWASYPTHESNISFEADKHCVSLALHAL